jgi:hypothetical protein
MKNFLPYKQSIELKKLGFDEPCIGSFTNIDRPCFFRHKKPKTYSKMFQPKTDHCVSPLYQEVFEWFRDEKNLLAEIFIDDDKTYGYLISYFVEQGRVDKPIKRQFKTYNEAQLACIDVMISSIKTTTLTVKII